MLGATLGRSPHRIYNNLFLLDPNPLLNKQAIKPTLNPVPLTKISIYSSNKYFFIELKAMYYKRMTCFVRREISTQKIRILVERVCAFRLVWSYIRVTWMFFYKSTRTLDEKTKESINLSMQNSAQETTFVSNIYCIFFGVLNFQLWF